MKAIKSAFLLTVLFLLPVINTQAQDDFIKQTINARLQEGDCATAEQLYNAWDTVDKTIEQQIAECKAAKLEKQDTAISTECQFISLGNYRFKRSSTVNNYQDPNDEEIVDSITKQNPHLKKYLYLGVKKKVDYSGRTTGMIHTDLSCEIITPDHRANMKNAVNRMIPRIPRGSVIVIDSIKSYSYDYMTSKDFRDEMTSLLLEAGYRVQTRRTTIQGNESTDKYIMNISTLDNALKISVTDSKSSEIVCMEIVRYDNVFPRPIRLTITPVR